MKQLLAGQITHKLGSSLSCSSIQTHILVPLGAVVEVIGMRSKEATARRQLLYWVAVRCGQAHRQGKGKPLK
jgi:hypothetical protein